MKKSGRSEDSEQNRRLKLGFYQNFPEISHKLVPFVASASNRKVQVALVNTLREANAKAFSLDALTDPSIEKCGVTFEFGIAEGGDFSFLNEEESTRIRRAIRIESLQVLDIVCAIRYHKCFEGKKAPLKFDYYMVRFRFDEYRVIQVFHERGPGYLSPKDVISFLFREVNAWSQKKLLRIATVRTSTRASKTP